MEDSKKITLDAPDLLVRYHKIVEGVYRKAVHDAVLKHKQAGNAIAISRKGKVLLLQPDEIILENPKPAPTRGRKRP
jgi:hypothetical protein